MKPCRTCGVVKPLGDFYPHPQMADGHLHHCKACRRVYQRGRVLQGLTQAIDRRRYRLNPNRVRQARRQAHAWTVRYPEKRRAQLAVQAAIQSGRLVRQPCEICGVRAHAHHPDYARPLDVRWLCPRHHARAHQEATA